MNDDAVRFGTSSRWTTLVAAHVNKTVCGLLKLLLSMSLKIGLTKTWPR